MNFVITFTVQYNILDKDLNVFLVKGTGKVSLASIRYACLFLMIGDFNAYILSRGLFKELCKIAAFRYLSLT